MALSHLPEVWLRGPLPQITPFLQPVAHALLQAREEIKTLVQNFPQDRLWVKPAGLASVGFHLQHMTGVLDRLFTYARAQSLTDQQLNTLRSEGRQPEEGDSVERLVYLFSRQIDRSLKALETIDVATLTEPRGVGRAQLPSTVFGLLVHAAEHTMRHTGQLLVTVRILENGG